MRTGKREYTRHIYELVPTKFTSYELYKLVELQGTSKLLTDFIKFERNAKKNKGYGFNIWLRIIDHNNWSECTLITGLRPTHKQNVFHGNKRKTENGKHKPESLILFHFLNDCRTAVVDYFNNYYTNNPFLLRDILNNHHYYIEQKKGA
jgi:hypothetical protein